MKIGPALAALAGLALAAFLIFQQGLAEVMAALRVAGWMGLAAITLFHVLPIFLCGVAWRVLLRHLPIGAWGLFVWARWIRDSIDGILPILPVSGELVVTRLLALRGVPLAGASVVVDMTGELLSQALFAMIGFGLLVARHPDAAYLTWLGLGVLLMTGEFVGFYIAQRRGLFRLFARPLDWFRRRKRAPRTEADATLHDQIQTLYDRRSAFVACILAHLGAWIVGAVEAWLGLWFLDRPLDLGDVLALEGLVYALRSIAFFVPLGAGIQEGAYVVVGGLLGLTPDLALGSPCSSGGGISCSVCPRCSSGNSWRGASSHAKSISAPPETRTKTPARPRPSRAPVALASGP